MKDLSAEIAEFVCHIESASMPADVTYQLRSAVLDGCASMLSGVPEPVSRHMLAVVQTQYQSGNATVIGFGHKTSLLGAALVNGALAHACDYDDSSWTMWGHPTAPVLPACLAVAESSGRSGAELLAAFAVGLEVEKA